VPQPYTHLLEGRNAKPSKQHKNPGQDVEEQELVFIVNENAKWHSLTGGQFGSFFFPPVVLGLN
jgi:hypothetical protein